MDIPESFQLSKRFTGIEHVSGKASIMVSVLPSSIEFNKSTVHSDDMKKRGVNFVGSKEVQLQKQSATLFEMWRLNKSEKFRNYYLLFGDSSKTIFVNVMAPDSSTELCDAVQKIILTTIYDEKMIENPFETLIFNFDFNHEEYKVAKNTSSGIVLTRDGELHTRSKDKATFTAGSSIKKVQVSNKKEFTYKRLKALSEADSLVSYKVDSTNIDHLPGYIVEAEAYNKKKEKGFIYLTILFDANNDYYIMAGTSNDSAVETKKRFEVITNSFKIKK